MFESHLARFHTPLADWQSERAASEAACTAALYCRCTEVVSASLSVLIFQHGGTQACLGAFGKITQ